jgi:hypothetical protein
MDAKHHDPLLTACTRARGVEHAEVIFSALDERHNCALFPVLSHVFVNKNLTPDIPPQDAHKTDTTSHESGAHQS